MSLMPEASAHTRPRGDQNIRRQGLPPVPRLPGPPRLRPPDPDTRVHEVDASQASSTPRELANHGRYVTAVRLAGNTLISGGYDGRLIWWDLQNNRMIRTTDSAHTRQIRQLAISPDGKKLASVG